MHASLHYIFDPLCGWCYGAGPMLRESLAVLGDELHLRFHPGLLYAQPTALDKEQRAQLSLADQRIQTSSGLDFGEAYKARVRDADQLVFDSTLPAAAVLAAERCIVSGGLDMLETIQNAHFQAGLDVCQREPLERFARGMDILPTHFKAALDAELTNLGNAAKRARAMLQASGAQGLPNFILEHGRRMIRIDHNRTGYSAVQFAAMIRTTATH
ncbi:DsbA family protein [Uliginosibacterium sediminicola]